MICHMLFTYDKWKSELCANFCGKQYSVESNLSITNVSGKNHLESIIIWVSLTLLVPKAPNGRPGLPWSRKGLQAPRFLKTFTISAWDQTWMWSISLGVWDWIPWVARTFWSCRDSAMVTTWTTSPASGAYITQEKYVNYILVRAIIWFVHKCFSLLLC